MVKPEPVDFEINPESLENVKKVSVYVRIEVIGVLRCVALSLCAVRVANAVVLVSSAWAISEGSVAHDQLLHQ